MGKERTLEAGPAIPMDIGPRTALGEGRSSWSDHGPRQRARRRIPTSRSGMLVGNRGPASSDGGRGTDRFRGENPEEERRLVTTSVDAAPGPRDLARTGRGRP